MKKVANKKRPITTILYLFLINGLTLCGGFIVFMTISLNALEKTAIIQTQQNLRTFSFSVKQLILNQKDLTLAPIPRENQVSLDQLIRETAAHDPGFRITVVYSDGRVLGDSDALLHELDNHANRPEIAKALAGEEAGAIRRSSVHGDIQVYYAIPFELRGHAMALRLSIPMGRNVFFSSNVRQDSVISTVAILFVILIITFVIAAKILRPLTELKKTARHYEEGDFDYVPSVTSPREFVELAENLQSMASTIQQNIQDISQSRDELRRLERVRKDFVANVSHELKTPVTAIGGFVETLQEGAIDDKDTAHHFLEIMAQQTSRLNNIIDDLLTLSRLEQEGAHIETQQINLLYLITDVMANYSYQAQTNNIAMDYEFFPKDAVIILTVNPGLISQALGNIVNNSVKYCPPGSKVHIGVQQFRGTEGAPWVRIVVEDTGNGIPEEYRQRIFERFFRVDKGRSRATGGTGLGLAIVHHIINIHGGTIKATNRLDGNTGARFEIELPGYKS